MHDADRDRDGDQRADASDASEETLSRAAGERRLEGIALQPDDDRGDHAARRQAEQEQAEEQHDDQLAAAGLARRCQQLRQVGAGDPGGRQQVGGEHAHLLRAAGDDRSDALGGLGRAVAGADGLVGHGAPLSDAELSGCGGLTKATSLRYRLRVERLYDTCQDPFSVRQNQLRGWRRISSNESSWQHKSPCLLKKTLDFAPTMIRLFYQIA